MTHDDDDIKTQLTVTYDERAISLWVRPQLDVPITLSTDAAEQLADNLRRGIADHENLLGNGI